MYLPYLHLEARINPCVKLLILRQIASIADLRINVSVLLRVEIVYVSDLTEQY